MQGFDPEFLQGFGFNTAGSGIIAAAGVIDIAIAIVPTYSSVSGSRRQRRCTRKGTKIGWIMLGASRVLWRREALRKLPQRSVWPEHGCLAPP